MDLLTEALVRMGRMYQPAAQPASAALMEAPDHVKMLVAKMVPIALSSWTEDKPPETVKECAVDVGSPVRLDPIEGSLSLDQPAGLALKSEAPLGEGQVPRKEHSVGHDITTVADDSKATASDVTCAAARREAKPGLLTSNLLDFEKSFSNFAAGFGGIITTRELGTLLNLLGQHPPEDVLKAMIDEINNEWAGNMNFPVFMSIAMTHLHCTPQFTEAFPVSEASITMDELEVVCKTLGLPFTDLKDGLFADVDCDGSIPGYDFCDIVINAPRWCPY